MLIVVPGPKGDIAVNISDFWSDQNGIAVRGWVSAEAGPPDDLEFVCDGATVPVTSWHAREDITKKAPPGLRGQAWGFWCYLPQVSAPFLTIQQRHSKKSRRQQLRLIRHAPKIPDWQKAERTDLFEE